jgi:hypothetical protein
MYVGRSRTNKNHKNQFDSYRCPRLPTRHLKIWILTDTCKSSVSPKLECWYCQHYVFVVKDQSSVSKPRTIESIAGTGSPQGKNPLAFWNSEFSGVVCARQKDCSGQVNIIEGIHQKWIWRTNHSISFCDGSYFVFGQRLLAIIPRCLILASHF